MKTTTIITALSLAACLTAFPSARAQDNAPESFANTLAVQPFYWLNNGVRIDYERRLKTPDHWLQLSAIGYYVEDNNNFWTLWDMNRNFNSAWGAGLETNYKYFPFGKIFYISAGLSAARFSVQYDSRKHTYITYEEEGLTYYESHWDEVEETQHFNRFGTNFFAGFQNRHNRRFLVDGYVGFGRVYSFYDKDKYYPDSYLNSLSYRGISLTIGFRVGFRL
jgi:hypothetical protein